MNLAQLKRLKELLGKSADTLAPSEITELATLKSAAKVAGYDPETGDEAKSEPDVMSQDEARKMVADESRKAVNAALEAIGLSAEAVKGIQTSLASKGDALTAEAIKGIVAEAGVNIDPDKLTEVVQNAAKAAAESAKGVSAEDLKKALSDFGAEQDKKNAKSRMEFDTGEAHFPCEHRSGNLTVAQKQLLNLCLMRAPEGALANSDGGRGVKRPDSANEGITTDQLSHAKACGERHLKMLRQRAIYGKALTTGGAGSGAELIPTDLSSDLMTRLYLESQVAAEFMASELDMPTDTFTLPLRTTRTTFYTGSENPGSNPTESTPGTGSVVLASGKLIGRAVYSYEADEDAIIAILPFLQEDMGSGAADAFEGALINGDTTATHQDSDIHAVTGHHAKLFKGLRKYALAGSVTTSFATGGINITNIKALKKQLKRWGVKPSEVLLLAGVNGYNDLVGLDETLTADKVGSNVARILTGEAPVLLGMRIIVSSQIREDLNASGVYDGVTMTKGSIILVHRPSWVVGVRRAFTVEVDRNITEQTNTVVASFRRAFMPKETPSTTLPLVSLGFNYTS